jgi:carnitine O-acetyltransferase
MAVRTFTRPSSLNESLASATIKMAGSEKNPAPSEASARDSTQSFPSEARDPLGHSTNPNSRPGITFAHEEKLPKLPIPELEASCQKYLAALKPLQGAKEHQDTVVAVEEFLKQDGPNLQEKLKHYAADKANYIEQFCMRSPVSNSSMRFRQGVWSGMESNDLYISVAA